MHRPPSVLLAVVALVGLGVNACGDDDASPAASDEGACRTVTVDIGDFAFDPAPVRAHPCDSVTWTNTHDQAHTSTGTGIQRWDTGSLAPGTTSRAVPFPDAGTFAYVCALHPFMHGEVVVS